MKKIVNSPFIYMFIILAVAILSSCESGQRELRREFSLQGHSYITLGVEGNYNSIHNPYCEKKDMLVLLDSLNKAK